MKNLGNYTSARPVGMNIKHLHDAIYSVICKSAFPIVTDVAGEQSRLNILRIVVGVIAFIRCGFIAGTSYYYFEPHWFNQQVSFPFLLSCLMCVLLLFLIVGFCTPVTILLLIASYDAFDTKLGTSNLGSMMFIQFLIALLACNVGKCYSMDACILRSHRLPLLRKILTRIYGLVGERDASQLTVIYFFGFFTYALISFSAVYFHLHDRYWLSGHTTGVMLTNSYLCRAYSFFRAFEQWSPQFFHWFSVCGNVGQTIFQVLMLPLIFLTWGKRFVFLWGCLFISLSIFFLQISYLPFMEIFQWCLFFQRSRGSVSQQTSAATNTGQQKIGGSRFYNVYLVGLSVFLLFCCFNFNHRGHLPWAKPLGFWPPNVFNETDLMMGDNWAVIYRLNQGQTKTLVPLNNEDGSRKMYHLSDLIYFGNSLRWRRMIIGKQPVDFNGPRGAGRLLIQKILRFDYRYTKAQGIVQYEIQILSNNSSRVDMSDLNAKYQPQFHGNWSETIGP